MVAGARARSLGRGDESAVAEASGMSRHTVSKAQGEVEGGKVIDAELVAVPPSRTSGTVNGTKRWQPGVRNQSAAGPNPRVA